MHLHTWLCLFQLFLLTCLPTALAANTTPTLTPDMQPPPFTASLPLTQLTDPLPNPLFKPYPMCAFSTVSMQPPTTRVPSTRLTRVQVSEALGTEHTTITQQVDKVTSLQFQQAINCCGFTSVAYALSTIGCPTTADDLFLSVGVDIESAVGDGMTLAEIYDASLRYINRKRLPVFVECYHFDKSVATEDGFRKAAVADAEGGIDDIVVLNFQVGIAHGWDRGGGSGHFSVMTALSPDQQDVIMADVHGIKYGTFWSTPIKQMFAAMSDKDSCGRARGALRYGRTDKSLTRPLPGLMPTLLDWTAPPSRYRSEYLQKYIPRKWDEGIGVRNMEGASALSSAMRLLHGDHANIVRIDEIMRALNESYTWQLNNFLRAGDVVSMANKLYEQGLSQAIASVKTLATCSGEHLKSTFEDSGCGEDGVAVLVSYDFNEAYGAPLLEREKGEAGALSHGAKTWSLVADFDRKADICDTGAVVLAPAHNVILAGRLWTTSFQRMAMAMRSVIEADCQVVVLDSR